MTQKDTVVSFLLLEKGQRVVKRESETHDGGGLSVEACRGSITTTTHRTPPTLESVHWSGVCVDLLEGERETCKPALGAFLTPGGGTVINVHESSLVSPTAFFTFFKS